MVVGVLAVGVGSGLVTREQVTVMVWGSIGYPDLGTRGSTRQGAIRGAVLVGVLNKNMKMVDVLERDSIVLL